MNRRSLDVAGSWTRVLAVLGRPTGLVARTRWLFRWACVLTLLFSVLAVLPGADAGDRWVLAVAVALLSTSWSLSARRAGPPWVADLLDAAGMCAFVLSSSNPPLVFGLAFSVMWLRAISSSTVRGLLQTVLSVVGISAAIPLWHRVPGNVPLDPAVLVGVFPIVFATYAVARHLCLSMVAREQGNRRDAVVTDLGTRLLGVTDAEAVLTEARRATHEIGGATPGLRVVAVAPAGDVVRVVDVVPVELLRDRALPASLVPDSPSGELVAVADGSLLDEVVEVRCRWTYLRLPGATDLRLFVGAPGQVPTEALGSLQAVSNQIALALRNSETHRELAVRARTDALTGLVNRAAFCQHLADAAAVEGGLAVLFVDLDDFKGVNDGLGHAAGDTVLRHVADSLRQVTRTGDVCARLGGDEFALLLRGVTPADAEQVGRRLVGLVCTPVPVSATWATVGASIGLSHSAVPCDGEELLGRADVAMYRAKASGKNRVLTWTAGGGVPVPAGGRDR